MARNRAAASSIANGNPSSLEQMRATVALLWSVSSKPGSAVAARSANSATASKPGIPPSVGSESAVGNASGDSRSTASPPMPRGLAAGGKDSQLGAGAQQRLGEFGGRVDHLFAVVKYQQKLPRREVFD